MTQITQNLLKIGGGSLSALLVFTGAESASAVVVNVGTFDVGPITFLDPDSPETAAGFQLGENVLLDFTVDNSVADVEPNIGDGNFDDPNGIITLTGAISGATIDYAGGIEIEIDDDEEFEIESLISDATSTDSPILAGDIDFDTQGTPFFTDPDDLALSLSELQASSFNSQSTNDARTEFFNPSTGTDETGMRFGPVPADNLVSEPIPFEAEGTMGLAALGGFFWYRKRKQAKNNYSHSNLVPYIS